ncbi:MAG: HAD family hydrolase [Archangium sp.]
MRPTVLLFDIDGTLISTGGAGRRAISRAFELLHKREDATSHFSFDGMTDRAIVRNGLTAIGVEATDANIDALLNSYIACLRESVHSVPDANYIVHTGMREVVEASLKAGAAVGLGTGNVREGARVKLERVGLYSKFSFGGFGDDHELRPELIRAGADRGAKLLNVKREEARVVIIGDTPKDVHAALAIGAECIGVSTGAHGIDELRDVGAKWAFNSLAEEGALHALLG